MPAQKEENQMKRKITLAMLMLATTITACGKTEAETEADVEETVQEVAVEENTEVEADKDAEKETEEVVQTADETTENAEQTTDDKYSKYEELIADCRDTITKGYDEYNEDDHLFSYMFAMYGEYDISGYAMMDLDGDGTDELIFGSNAASADMEEDNSWRSVVYNIFTLKDGEIVTLVDGGERNRYYICPDKTVANEASGGAAYTAYAKYKVEAAQLKLQDCIFSDFTDEAQTEIGWYRTAETPWEDKSNPITEDDANKIIEEYKYEDVRFTPFIEK